MQPNPAYRELEPLERVQAGDEFSWRNGHDTTENDWFPCETFVGQRVENLQRRSNVIFRRPLEELPLAT